ncbi:MAG: amidohydrolase family protein [Rhodobacteraceae bacterium]|nr:amidohydrolase family protein [Paracoccaceae bacterium]
MTDRYVRTLSYFDGETHQNDGPYIFAIRDGVIAGIAREATLAGLPGALDLDAAFLSPGLVEAHAHLFLKGEELDGDKRAAFLKSDREAWLAAGHANLGRAMDHGITLIRDAGDNAGINTEIRDAVNYDPSVPIRIRSAGLGLRKPGRYSSLFAIEVAGPGDIRARIADLAGRSDDLKVFETGIIDFDAGAVKGHPQFDFDAFTLIAVEARRHGMPVFVHCSGAEGLDIITRCEIDSVEHGFFMRGHHLQAMAERRIAWVPTFSPVHFQWENPGYAGWSPQTLGNLRMILDAHLDYVGRAIKLGVPLVAGSDAGSQGVVHGRALIDELLFFDQAGMAMDDILASATSRPRERWKIAGGRLAIGQPLDIAFFAASPYGDAGNLRQIRGVALGGTVRLASAG